MLPQACLGQANFIINCLLRVQVLPINLNI